MAKTYIIPIDPVAKPRMTQKDKWAKRPIVMRYRAFCDELRLVHKVNIPEDYFHIEFLFRIAMPKSWSKKKKRYMDGRYHQQTPDIDNLIKSFFDAVLEDDRHIARVAGIKLWSSSGSIYLEAFNHKKED